MTNWNTNLSRKELYSGAMVIFIGLFYLLSTAGTIANLFSGNYEWKEIKMFALALFYLLGGILYLWRKNAGWIMTAAILLNFVFIMMVFIISLSQSGGLTSFTLMALFLFILLILSFIFLFDKQTRRKFLVNNKSYLLTLLVYGLLSWINFGL